MNRKIVWLAMATIICFASVGLPQVISNGQFIISAITGALPAGTNILGKIGFDTANNTIKLDAANSTVTGITNALPVGANIIGKVGIDPANNTVSAAPFTGCGTTKVRAALAAVPTALTTVQATTTCVIQLNVFNTNTSGSGVTFLLTDAQGSPITGIPTTNIAPASFLPLSFPGGLELTSGFKVQAGGTGLTYNYLGVQ